MKRLTIHKIRQKNRGVKIERQKSLESYLLRFFDNSILTVAEKIAVVNEENLPKSQELKSNYDFTKPKAKVEEFSKVLMGKPSKKLKKNVRNWEN